MPASYLKGAKMAHSIVHAEIRSTDPDATRKFFADLLGWTYPDQGAIPGYTFVDTGAPEPGRRSLPRLGRKAPGPMGSLP